jgi:3-methyladenine DNA glycosylase AlkD
MSSWKGSAEMLASLIKRAKKTEHGFADILLAAEEVFTGLPPAETIELARQLYASAVPQARMLATFLFGKLAAHSKEALAFLHLRVSQDEDWRVQEILAKAFDQYCSDSGYERSISVMRDWLSDTNPNTRRAVTEGLRIWTARPYFDEHPETAIQMLSSMRFDASERVRKSVGNALRDISRKHKKLVTSEIASWDKSDTRVQQICKLIAHASR